MRAATALDVLACPLDGLALSAAGGGYRCARGHTYDRAREGYCNLLAVQHKASLDPGDSREMVAARRRFLDAGHFAPIADAVFAVIAERMDKAPRDRPFRVVDAGCGEGYYLERIAHKATSEGLSDIALAGFDVSKWAVKAAAKRTRDVAWLVANNRHPPFTATSLDMVLCVFGFPVWDGFAPVLAEGGCVLLVDPGTDHLIELREIIYPKVERSGPPPLQAPGFRLAHEQALSFCFDLESPGAIADLLVMTPHGYRMGEAGRAAIADIAQLTITADVVVRVVERQALTPTSDSPTGSRQSV